MYVKKILRKITPLSIRKAIYYIRTIPNLKKEIADLRKDLLYFKVLQYYEHHPSAEFESEISYLKKNGSITPFPYKQIKPIGSIEGGFDDNNQMAYILHQNKKLFFPEGWSLEGARQVYANYIAIENILGGGYSERSPHQYLTETFKIEEDDVVIDVGAAEGLFLLDVIDKVKRGYLFEPDPGWLLPLKATFKPYMHKVVIIEKHAANDDSVRETKLDSCVEADADNVFIKMDVEGYEQQVLSGAENLLMQKKDVKVACCTYHKNDDAQHLKNFFEQKGFQTEFSDGYVLFPYDEQIKPPYFRRGMIRAFKVT